MKKLNWIIAFFGLGIIASCENKKSTSHHPNVILIISDQWSTRVSDGSGNYDNGILTPGIDLLAKQGISFNQAYSTYPLYPRKSKSIHRTLFSP